MTETNQPTMHLLSSLRHECRACGHCCHGHRVSLQDDEEIKLIEEHGVALNVEEPVVDGAMRTVDGHCAFLDKSDNLCRIHKVFGMEAKPFVCQQYPLRVSITEHGWRAGIDPGCTNNWASWRTGAPAKLEALVKPHKNVRDPDPAEGQLLHIATQEGMTVPLMLQVLCEIAGGELDEDQPDETLPPGFAARLTARLKAMRLARFLAVPMVGNSMRECLNHLVPLVESLDGDNPPPLVLSDEQHAFTIDLVKRILWQRVGDKSLPDYGQVVVFLAGAVLCGWADPRPHIYGPAISAWARVMRHRGFWAGIVPRPETLQWLMTGQLNETSGPATEDDKPAA